jgi:hypothetical protein
LPQINYTPNPKKRVILSAVNLARCGARREGSLFVLRDHPEGANQWFSPKSAFNHNKRANSRQIFPDRPI